MFKKDYLLFFFAGALLSCSGDFSQPNCDGLIYNQDVNITYYSSGDVTSCENKPGKGQIALSRDLAADFECGQAIIVTCQCPLDGIYTYTDKMNKRYENYVDIYVPLIDYLRAPENYKKGNWKGKIYFTKPKY